MVMSTPEGFTRGPTLLEENELGLFQKIPRWGSLLEKVGASMSEPRNVPRKGIGVQRA